MADVSGEDQYKSILIPNKCNFCNYIIIPLKPFLPQYKNAYSGPHFFHTLDLGDIFKNDSHDLQ